MTKNRLFAFFVLALVSMAVTSCATRANSQLIDRERGIYEISVRSFQDCGGIWHGENMCIENLRPQINSLAVDVCGKLPNAIRSCGERDGASGREVYCTVECNAPPRVESSIIRKARICQDRGGVWIDNRCELDLSQ